MRSQDRIFFCVTKSVTFLTCGGIFKLGNKQEGSIMHTMMIILSALNLFVGPSADLLRHDYLQCRSTPLGIEGMVAVRVSCNHEVGSKIAISYASSYLKVLGMSQYKIVNAIVGGDGTDEKIEYSKEWAIGFGE